jgi:hypothetical protein
MRFSRKQKKELIGRFGIEVYRRLVGEELVLHKGFPYTKPNQNQRMYPYNFMEKSGMFHSITISNERSYKRR